MTQYTIKLEWEKHLYKSNLQVSFCDQNNWFIIAQEHVSNSSMGAGIKVKWLLMWSLAVFSIWYQYNVLREDFWIQILTEDIFDPVSIVTHACIFSEKNFKWPAQHTFVCRLSNSPTGFQLIGCWNIPAQIQRLHSTFKQLSPTIPAAVIYHHVLFKPQNNPLP